MEVVGFVDLLVEHVKVLVSSGEVAGDLLLVLLLQVEKFRLLFCEFGLETLFVLQTPVSILAANSSHFVVKNA
jgi:hypothetical protein